MAEHREPAACPSSAHGTNIRVNIGLGPFKECFNSLWLIGTGTSCPQSHSHLCLESTIRALLDIGATNAEQPKHTNNRARRPATTLQPANSQQAPMAAAAASASAASSSSGVDTDLYSRQIGAYGMET